MTSTDDALFVYNDKEMQSLDKNYAHWTD